MASKKKIDAKKFIEGKHYEYDRERGILTVSGYGAFKIVADGKWVRIKNGSTQILGIDTAGFNQLLTTIVQFTEVYQYLTNEDNK